MPGAARSQAAGLDGARCIPVLRPRSALPLAFARYGRVGVAQDVLVSVVAGGRVGDANRGGGEELVAVEVEGAGERLLDAGGHVGGVGRPLDAVEQDGELVAAEAGHRVHPADAVFEPAREVDEEAVAEVVAERVVDDLEAVEIDEEDGEAVGGGALGPLDGEAQAVGEARAVGQARERVVEGELVNLLLGALAIRAV